MAKSTVKMMSGDLEKLKKQLDAYADPPRIEEFMQACAKELAARLLRKVIKRTPVGKYPKESGKMGGTLRRGWTGEKRQGAQAYVNSLPVTHKGHDYVIEIINPVDYASYVEYGHRTRNHRGWAKGQFFLTISEDEIRSTAPAILEKKILKQLEGMMQV